jgi:hypothetical protein
MKRIFIVIFIIVSVNSFPQIQSKTDGAGTFDIYPNHPEEYMVIKSGLLMDPGTGQFNDKIIIPPGTVFAPSFLGGIYLYGSVPEVRSGTGLTVMDYKDEYVNGYISVDDVAVRNSDMLPDSIIIKENSAPDYYWIPAHSIKIVRGGERDTIFDYEYFSYQGYDYSVTWYEVYPEPMTFTFNNIVIRLMLPVHTIFSMIKK